MTPAPIIEVENVVHAYERWGHRLVVFKDLNLTVTRGEWITVVGPNGSGKSTLLRLLSGQLAVQTGRVLVAGRDMTASERLDLAQEVFFVNQDPTAGTAPTLTVAEHIMLAEGRSYRDPARRAKELLANVRLEVAPNQLVSTLSGGQRQLLVLLMAKLRPASVILLDEPLSALDPYRAELCDMALDLLHRDGKTLVLVTHDLDYAVSRGDRTVVLLGGEIALDQRGARTRGCISAVWSTGIEART